MSQPSQLSTANIFHKDCKPLVKLPFSPKAPKTSFTSKYDTAYKGVLSQSTGSLVVVKKKEKNGGGAG